MKESQIKWPETSVVVFTELHLSYIVTQVSSKLKLLSLIIVMVKRLAALQRLETPDLSSTQSEVARIRQFPFWKIPTVEKIQILARCSLMVKNKDNFGHF